MEINEVHKKPTLKVVKIGGGVIEDPEALAHFCALFASLSGPKILIHGGGKSATLLAKKLGVDTKIIDGRRITPKESLEVIVMSYAGAANKNIVSSLQANHCNAIGLSGADGNSILAHKRILTEIDYGYVGDIDLVNAALIDSLLALGLCPVFCAITHNGNGQLLNTNADTIAAAISAAMAPIYETSLYYCFEKKGVLSNIEKNIVIPVLTPSKMQIEIASGVIQAGMIPKLSNGFTALREGVHEVIIGNENILKGKEPFTRLKMTAL
jgi:acetylglutamate kinase